MLRKQIYIDEELERGLKAVAARTGEAEAVHVRAALREYLRGHEPIASREDPLSSLIGIVDDENLPDDVAEQHDHYLYGAPKGHP